MSYYLRRVLPYLRPYWLLALLSGLVTVLSSLAGLLAPWPLKILIDNVLGQDPLPEVLARPLGGLVDDRVTLLLLAVGAGLAVALLDNGLHVVANYVNTRLEQGIVLDFRNQLFRHAQRLSVAYTDQVSTGRLMYGINFEASAAGGLIMALQPLAQSALTLVGIIWISLQIDVALALLALVVVPLLYYLIGYYATHIQQRLAHVKGMEADSISIVHEAMSLLRVITAFAREEHENQRFLAQGLRTVDARVGVTVRQTLFSLGVNLTTATGTALVLGFGAYQALQGQLTVGQLMVMLAYVHQMYKPLEAISYTIGSLQDRFVGLQMAFHVLDTQPIVQEPPDARALDRARGEVAFEGVGFSYPGREGTLREVTFNARAGQVVALVGPTGAGKTTLVNLIPRFYDPSAGRVLLDGVDVRTLQLRSLREQVSLVPQEPLLFGSSIAENIRYGRLEATDDEVVEAARSANAHDFITRLPEGYATRVGERGAQLSGGERQRISVARAFLKDAPVLILDEPTSAIDSRTEAVILDALDRLMVGRTTFVIAHRLSTVRHADLILVLDQGRLVEQGTHDELLALGGLYRQLHDVQIGHRQRGGSAAVAAPIPETGPEPAPPAPDASYRVRPPLVWVAGQRRSYPVTVTNTGDEVWRAGGESMVRLSVHFGDLSDVPHEGWRTDERFALSADVASGDSLTLTVEVGAPAEPGRFVLRHRLVMEGVRWFDQVHRTEVVTRAGSQPETAERLERSGERDGVRR